MEEFLYDSALHAKVSAYAPPPESNTLGYSTSCRGRAGNLDPTTRSTCCLVESVQSGLGPITTRL